MPDLAGEVVAQLERLHDADRSPLYLAGPGVKLSLKRKGARLMYVLQGSRDKQSEVLFDLAHADDAIVLFVAMALDGKYGSDAKYLLVSVHHDDGEKLASQVLMLDTDDIFNVATSKLASSLLRMLSVIKNAVA